MSFARITGWGHYLPENIVTNFDLEKRINTTDEWIRERSGIRERRFYNPEKDTVTSLAEHASRKAIAKAGLSPSDIDLIIFATLSPDYFFPGCGVLLQKKLELGTTPAFDIRQQCSGFVYGISMADQYIKSGMYENILLVGSEIQSQLMEISDRGRTIAVLFGDGAGAVVISKSNKPGVYSTHLHSQGEFADELCMENPNAIRSITPEMLNDGSMLPYMNGRMVFKHAVTRFEEVILEALEHNRMQLSDLDMVIPHQANQRITEAIRSKLGMDPEKIYSNIHKYGNTTAASIPIALSEAIEEGKIQKGDIICLAAFGSGFTWGSALLSL
jgi:3-oxoacyl-[acyl-carrier-protein] synthase-3